MCLIAYQRAGTPALFPEWIANGWQHNKDGAGYMFAHAGKLIVRKPFYKRKELAKAYLADHAQYGEESAFIVHFRYATHGSKAEVNIHPHYLADGRAGLVHNGILEQFTPYEMGDISDTVLFCRTVLAMRPVEQYTDEGFNQFLAEMIGEDNKLAIMDEIGNVSIVNSHRGVWLGKGEYWFSNGTYSYEKPSPVAGHNSGVARGTCFSNEPLPGTYTGRYGDDWAATDEELWKLEQRIEDDERLTDDEWERYADLSAYWYDTDRHYELAMRRDGR